MKRSERKAMMRARILRVATDMYIKADPETIEMRQLARNIGISSATLYKYFSSKQELSQAIAMRMLTKYHDMVMSYLKDQSLTFPEVAQRMQRLSKRMFSRVHIKMIDFVFRLYQNNSEVNRLFGSQSNFWRHFVARGRKEGYIADNLSDTAVFIYIDMFFQYFRNPQHMDKFKLTPQLLQQIDHELDMMFYRGLLGVNGDIEQGTK
ncbi:TetR/AcrR family transcriptional regulator [Sporolactobacillus sp. CPB3-1]|uniref:TetR/AcrR family transcriptional regulator n=1 Tax=Sporolactobacillus mangiferae TaxID=2940498 RepID=A0ABT0M9A8_9BACL|nr:TetR/AcrR family transcriptional regulator [Sporolactobacillus mangiferae]MCL1631460.1 TetR/AcrR family transcriptional regulator [Sporolactobacillus mangiferae]